jgi:hypothetical protein
MSPASAASTAADHDAGTRLGDLGVGEGVARERVVARFGLCTFGGESSAGPLLQSRRGNAIVTLGTQKEAPSTGSAGLVAGDGECL